MFYTIHNYKTKERTFCKKSEYGKDCLYNSKDWGIIGISDTEHKAFLKI